MITSGYATIGMDVGNLAGLRTFRVLRALKTVSIMPGTNVYYYDIIGSAERVTQFESQPFALISQRISFLSIRRGPQCRNVYVFVLVRFYYVPKK